MLFSWAWRSALISPIKVNICCVSHFVIISPGQTSMVATWSEITGSMSLAGPRLLLLLLTCLRVSGLTHPCHSARGRDTDICRQLTSLCHQTEIKMAVCHEIDAEERIDVGIALLEPSAGTFISTLPQLWSWIKCHRYQIIGSPRASELPDVSFQHSWWSRGFLHWLWIPRQKGLANITEKRRGRELL